MLPSSTTQNCAVKSFSFQPTEIAGLVVIQPFSASDSRGLFQKSFESGIFQKHGIPFTLCEDLTSYSKKGVLRGLHFQSSHSQDKLVHVLCGSVYDVAVDLRKDSPTFGHWKGFYLSQENQTMVYIPQGFAHGFLALDEIVCFHYLCGSPYSPQTDGGVIWNDDTLKIDWPLDKVESVILSEKDRALPSLSQLLAENHGVLFSE